MYYNFFLAMHLLSAVIWVGGMFFAYLILRPVAASNLQPPERLTLWNHVLSKFFRWVFLAVFVLFSTGFYMVWFQFSGFQSTPLYVHLMTAIGLVMAIVFLWVVLVPFRTLQVEVFAKRWPEAGKALGRIRWGVAFNLTLGVLLVALVGGRIMF